MFPLSIRLKKKLNFDNTELTTSIVKVISDALEKLKVDKITVEKTHIEFRNSFFNGQGRWHLMAPVDSGFFDYSNVTKTLVYQFSTTRMCIISLVFSIIFSTLARSIGVGLFFFLWLYGMNWITTLIRHKHFFNKLTRQMEV